MKANDMAPFTAWLPARPNQDFDLVVKLVGPGASVLLKEWTPIAHSLIERGFAVMAQSGRLNGNCGDFVLKIRIATRTFYSMGYGCDVLVNLGDKVPEFSRFSLQPGSVLLWEPPKELPLHLVLPEEIISYPIPLTELSAQYAEGLSGRGLAALGVLLHLLGVPEESLQHLTEVLPAPRSFASGWDFARRALKKHDAYSLPLPATDDGPSRMILTPEQAIMLGFAVSSCECQTMCDHELIHSTTHWMARHTGMAGAMVSVLQSDSHPGVQAYRGSQGRVMAMLRGDDSAIASCLSGFDAPRVFVAADIPDALRLLIEGHDLIRSGLSDGVRVLIEETVALRHQSVEIPSLVEMIRRRSAVIPDTIMPCQPETVDAMVEQDGAREADVGFVAWGAAQGVVRDALTLCRSFGLNVVGFYPKVIVPFPQEELEAFARTVDRVVLVESSQMQGYEERLRAACSFQPAVLRPLLGQSLTPMDIFLREGLGAL
jgi:hypothetical protein